MNRSKFIIVISLALFAAPLISACNRTEGAKSSQKTIAVIPKGVSHTFWLTVKAGAEAAGKDLNVKIVWNGPRQETDYTGQMNIVEDMINQRVDGIVLAPSHGTSLIKSVESAQRQGIPVTIFDSGISTENYVSYVSTDNRKGGIVAAERMGKILGGNGKVAILGVKKGSVSTDEREEGFRDTIQKEFPGITLVPIIFYGEANAAKSLDVAETVLTAHSDLTGLFASNESSTVGAVSAIRQRNLAGRVRLVGFDATADLVKNVREGAIDSLVLQNPFKMGYEGVKTIVDKIGGKQPERRIDTGVELLTKDNVDTPEIQKLIK
ncbi:MAG TPA: substrate-binding domain-containing protein [Blastocatellia bacterium]|nr:substrate-binding domain-containing protein [Blastocatellia bacterium]